MNETNTLYVRCLSDPRWASEEIHRLREVKQERDDIMEARRLIRSIMDRHRLMSPSQLHQELHTVLQVLT